MKIQRVISYFDKNSELLVGELDVSTVSLDSLSTIFSLREDDPLMYYPYDIDVKVGEKLSKLLGLTFDFSKYVYQIDCFKLK